MSYKHCSDLAETYVNTILNEGFNNIDNIPFALILFDMMMVERLNGNKNWLLGKLRLWAGPSQGLKFRGGS